MLYVWKYEKYENASIVTLKFKLLVNIFYLK